MISVMCECKVCGNTENNQSYTAYERMYNLRDEFVYFKCSRCGCLQIREIPEDMSRYYPSDYYSFHLGERASLKSRIANFLLRHAIATRFGRFDIIGYMALLYKAYYRHAHPFLTGELCGANARVLDVGCGNGDLLNLLSCCGFANLVGADPFIEKDISYPNGGQIFKKNVYDIEGVYDLVMMNHSFEHMDAPLSVMRRIHEILSDNGVLLIRIPVADTYAWRKYGMSWWQVDAPRHFFLHTIKSMTFLAENSGFKLDKVVFDSSENQFVNSEKYLRNMSLFEDIDIDSKMIKHLRRKTKELNLEMDGDQARFYLRKA